MSRALQQNICSVLEPKFCEPCSVISSSAPTRSFSVTCCLAFAHLIFSLFRSVFLWEYQPTPFQLPTLPRISSSTRPDSSKTLALCKSCTYLLLNIQNWKLHHHQYISNWGSCLNYQRLCLALEIVSCRIKVTTSGMVSGDRLNVLQRPTKWWKVKSEDWIVRCRL